MPHKPAPPKISDSFGICSWIKFWPWLFGNLLLLVESLPPALGPPYGVVTLSVSADEWVDPVISTYSKSAKPWGPKKLTFFMNYQSAQRLSLKVIVLHTGIFPQNQSQLVGTYLIKIFWKRGEECWLFFQNYMERFIITYNSTSRVSDGLHRCHPPHKKTLKQQTTWVFGCGVTKC